MMKKKTPLLAIAALVVIGLAWLTVSHEKSSTTIAQSDTLLAVGLKEKLNDLTRIELSRGEQKVTLQQSDNGWNIKEKYNYPADIGKVRNLTVSLASSTLKEKKTKQKERYEKLGLDEESATRVVLYTDDEAPISDVYIGNQMSQLDGTYIYREGEDQTWLVSGKFAADIKAEDWLNTELFSIERKRVRNITIDHPKEKTVKSARESKDQTDYTLSDVPSGRKVSSQYSINNLASALENVELEGVIPAKDFSFDKDKTINTTVQSFDGLEAFIQLMEKDGKKWAVFDLAFKESLVESEKEEKKGEKSEEKENMTPIPPGSETRQEIERITPKLSGWVFALPDYKYGLLTKKMDDLTEEEKQEKDKDE